ncbi:MAG: nitroreductase family protein [Bacteroidia bacterium]|nr:nitroreductase family protein [Bacteroidia bacterium]
MSFLDAMRQRYTTKKYEPGRKLEPEQREALKEILRLCPSSINSQPWRFTFVNNPETKKQLAEASFFNDQKVLDCDTLVIFSRINDLATFENQLLSGTHPTAHGYYKKFLEPLGAEKVKAWFDKQVYLAIGVFLSACADMQIDSTPMEGIDPNKYDEILNQKHHTSLVAVAIGHRALDDANQLSIKPKARLPLDEVIKSI